MGDPRNMRADPQEGDGLERGVVRFPGLGGILHRLRVQVAAELNAEFPDAVQGLHFGLHCLPDRVGTIVGVNFVARERLQTLGRRRTASSG